MLTITHLARALNLSRSTLLYYERLGLLCPTLRGANGYRHYGEAELARDHAGRRPDRRDDA